MTDACASSDSGLEAARVQLDRWSGEGARPRWHALVAQALPQERTQDDEPDPLAAVALRPTHAEVREVLVDGLIALTGELRDIIFASPAGPIDGPLWADLLAADHLEPVGETGSRIAVALRLSAERRHRSPHDAPGGIWSFWADPDHPQGARFPKALLRVLWWDRLRTQVERGEEIRSKTHCPAVPLHVLRHIEGWASHRDLGSVVAQRLIVHLVRASWGRAIQGFTDHDRLHFLGGIQGLADAIGVRGRDRDRLRPILRALERERWLDLERAFVETVHQVGSAQGRQAALIIQLGPVLPIGAVKLLADDAFSTRDRRLIPVVELGPIPDGVRRNDYRRVYAFQTALLVEMRNALAASLTWTESSIVAPAIRSSGIPQSTARTCIEGWCATDGGWIERRPGGALTLTEPSAVALYDQVLQRLDRSGRSDRGV